MYNRFSFRKPRTHRKSPTNFSPFKQKIQTTKYNDLKSLKSTAPLKN